MVAGVPGFYYVNPALALGVDAPVVIERAAMFLVDPLKDLLPTLVDFDRISSGCPRLTLGLTTVQSGEIRYFDSKRETRLLLSTCLARVPSRLPFRRCSSTESIIGTAASTQTRRLRSSSVRIPEEIRSCLRFGSSTGAVRCPTRFNMLSCGWMVCPTWS